LPEANSKPARDKVRARRAPRKALGLRLVQIWVPDVRSPRFAAMARRQSLAVARSSRAHSDQAFIDAMSDDSI
jgi:Protein  of unknown function (DUF3018)